ncbi:hypothetical protein [Kitasatospora azatica]|nr:hypothetical protein [Kitasatospora azatica]
MFFLVLGMTGVGFFSKFERGWYNWDGRQRIGVLGSFLVMLTGMIVLG